MSVSQSVSPVTRTAGGGGGDWTGQTGLTGAARIRTLTFSINSIFVWSPQEGEGGPGRWWQWRGEAGRGEGCSLIIKSDW